MLPGALVCPPQDPVMSSQRYSLTAYFPDLLQLEGCCAAPHNATRDHTQMESTNLMPHNTTNNQARDLRLKLLQCIDIAGHHGLTPRDFTNSTSCFYFMEITPTAQASRLLPSFTLSNCPWIRSQSLSIANRSERENQQSNSQNAP